MSIVDKSLSFGLQNYFFVLTDVSDLTYDYVGYMDHKGAILIARYPKDGSAALYFSTNGVFSTVWAAKFGYTYVLPSQLVDPRISD